MPIRAPEVLTFGCRLNSAESEEMRRLALASGLENAIIVNTCAVTAEAERQAGQAIRRAKREHPEAQIIVTGCASQINAAKFASMREVDGVIPNDRKLDPQSFKKLAHQNAASKRMDDPLPPLAHMQRAFIQIQNGCDHQCTFCIIPFGRGASRSFALERIIEQLHARMADGFKEAVLTGVDIASYGRDLPGKPTLGALIGKILAEAPSLPRLRLSSMDPAAFDEDLWRLIADEPRLMPHLHLSLQSGDDLILKRMKRRHSRADVLALCRRARELRPDIVFGADIIAGFPTETDAMFENTWNLVRECGLTWLHIFPYSSRKGTAAARMPQVQGAVRLERAERLRAFGEKAAKEHHKSLVGKTVSVLVENNGIGCTPHFAKLTLRGKAPVGHIVNAACVGVEKNTAVAEFEV